MSSQVSDTSNGVALNFDVGTQHLPDQWFEPTEFHDEKLVIG